MEKIDTPGRFNHDNKAQILFPDAHTLPMQKKVVFAFLYILIFPALLLLISCDVSWPEGWIFSLWFIVLCYSIILYLYRTDPALLQERNRQPGIGNQQRWDRYVVYGLVIGLSAGYSSCRWMPDSSGDHLFSPYG